MIVFSRRFSKNFKHLYKKYPSLRKDLNQLIEALEKDFNMGIDLGNGLRKIRMSIASKNKGKSGGARVISYACYIDNLDRLVLLDIYDKSEKDSISDKELQAILIEEGF